MIVYEILLFFINMAIVEQNITFQTAQDIHQLPTLPEDPLIVADGWSSYKDLGPHYCSAVYPKNPFPKPVAIGPVTPISLQEGRAIQKPVPENKGYKYGLSVYLGKPCPLDESGMSMLTEILDMEVPTVYFDDLIHGEKEFKDQEFRNGELWRIVRFCSGSGERLAVPFVRFNPDAVNLKSRYHYSFDNTRSNYPHPSMQTYAPMTGRAEEFVLGINGTDVSARVRLTAQLLGI